MSIPETYHFDKSGEVVRFPHFRSYFLTIVIVLVAILAFGVGRLTGEGHAGVNINYPDSSNSQFPISNSQSSPNDSVKTENSKIVNSAEGSVYASSAGTRYYFATCKSTVSEKNKITFATPAMAEQAGYTLATTCKKP